HALAHGCAKPAFFDDFENFARVIDSLHRERAGSAAFDELGDTETCRCFDRCSRMRSFHWPDALFEPIDESKIIGGAAKDCLTEMNVCLNETGNNRTTVSIDHRVGCLSHATNFRDALIANEQITTHDGVAIVHRHKRSVLYED